MSDTKEDWQQEDDLPVPDDLSIPEEEDELPPPDQEIQTEQEDDFSVQGQEITEERETAIYQTQVVEIVENFKEYKQHLKPELEALFGDFNMDSVDFNNLMGQAFDLIDDYDYSSKLEYPDKPLVNAFYNRDKNLLKTPNDNSLGERPLIVPIVEDYLLVAKDPSNRKNQIVQDDDETITSKDLNLLKKVSEKETNLIPYYQGLLTHGYRHPDQIDAEEGDFNQENDRQITHNPIIPVYEDCPDKPRLLIDQHYNISLLRSTFLSHIRNEFDNPSFHKKVEEYKQAFKARKNILKKKKEIVHDDYSSFSEFLPFRKGVSQDIMRYFHEKEDKCREGVFKENVRIVGYAFMPLENRIIDNPQVINNMRKNRYFNTQNLTGDNIETLKTKKLDI